MAIPHLTDEQIRTWTRDQKDRWWLDNVFRGSMAQLTLRSALTGFLLGGALSATNLYVGAKTGWTLGVGITSVILAFAVFRIMARVGARDMTILENNCSQSIATAAGYMTGPLISGMAAYMWVENVVMPWWQMLGFNIVLSLLGVLVAFPMKRRFINDEQQPFPEGRACGVVLDTLYSSAANVGVFKARALAISAGAAGLITFISGASYMRAIAGFFTWLGSGKPWSQHLADNKQAILETWHLPHDVGFFYDWLASLGAEPKLAGVPIRQIGLIPTLELAMIGAGGLMGIRAAVSMIIGMVINFVILVPLMVHYGEIKPPPNGGAWSPAYVLNNWALWWGITIMIVASMIAMFAKPQVFVDAFRMLTGKGNKAENRHDVLKDIELPLWISWIGIPILGAAGVFLAWYWFEVPIIYGATAIPLIILLTLIAASSTGLTGITPTGSLSKIPQFTYGALNPKHPPTNLMTAVMCVEVASNASNLLMDIKPGYMLGAKPRQQAIGHCIGVVAGALASTPLFYALFMSDYNAADAAASAAASAEAGVADTYIQNVMAPAGGQFTFPSALQWKGVSDLMATLFGGGTGTLLTTSMIISMVIAGVAGVVLEVTRIRTKNKFPISPIAIGLGVVIPPLYTLAMFAGALFFWIMNNIYKSKPDSKGNLLWIQTQEPICAGLIAGAALVGIGDVLVRVFLLSGLG
ncbi:MAG: OPT/YSL family transporter [Phycisphaerales bacterium]